MSGIGDVEFWGRDIEASSPDLNLFLAMFLHGFKFVETLKSSVVTFVESPFLDDGDIVAVNFVSRIVEGLNGSGKYGGVADIE